MNITKGRLKELIKEELQIVLNEAEFGTQIVTADDILNPPADPEPELTWEELSMDPTPDVPWSDLSKEEQTIARLNALEQEAGQLRGELTNLRRTTPYPEMRQAPRDEEIHDLSWDDLEDIGIPRWTAKDLENLLQKYGRD